MPLRAGRARISRSASASGPVGSFIVRASNVFAGRAPRTVAKTGNPADAQRSARQHDAVRRIATDKRQQHADEEAAQPSHAGCKLHVRAGWIGARDRRAQHPNAQPQRGSGRLRNRSLLTLQQALIQSALARDLLLQVIEIGLRVLDRHPTVSRGLQLKLRVAFACPSQVQLGRQRRNDPLRLRSHLSAGLLQRCLRAPDTGIARPMRRRQVGKPLRRLALLFAQFADRRRVQHVAQVVRCSLPRQRARALPLGLDLRSFQAGFWRPQLPIPPAAAVPMLPARRPTSSLLMRSSRICASSRRSSLRTTSTRCVISALAAWLLALRRPRLYSKILLDQGVHHTAAASFGIVGREFYADDETAVVLRQHERAQHLVLHGVFTVRSRRCGRHMRNLSHEGP